MKSKGTVYLVGAGPGDPQLLTLRGADLLRRADVVVLDALVNAELLSLAPAGAEVVQRSKDRPMTQDELNALLLARAREGKLVVRLKGGDPYIFGRGGEEAQSLAAAGIPFEVVPGVSSISAVPNYAGIPLTHREHCSSFTVFTGHQDPATGDTRLDWDLIAREPGTKVILMGAERIAQLTEALREHGMPLETPVAVVQSGTTSQQACVAGTLADIAARAAKAQLAAPAVTILGSVVQLRGQLNWFESKPLFEQRIVVTRAREQAAPLTRLLQERGAEVLEVPCLRFGPPADHRPFAEALSGLHEYQWIVFTSANGVTAFFELFFRAFKDLRDLGGVRIAAVGPATAAKLEELHLQVDAMPKRFVAREIGKALTDCESIENLRILLLRAEVANPELPKLLEDLGAIVDDVACYQTLREVEDRNGHAAALTATGADWITFASASAVEHFHARFNLPELLKRFPRMKVASIGPETTKAIAAISTAPVVEARVHTIEGLTDALERATEKKRPA